MWKYFASRFDTKVIGFCDTARQNFMVRMFVN